MGLKEILLGIGTAIALSSTPSFAQEEEKPSLIDKLKETVEKVKDAKEKLEDKAVNTAVRIKFLKDEDGRHISFNDFVNKIVSENSEAFEGTALEGEDRYTIMREILRDPRKFNQYKFFKEDGKTMTLDEALESIKAQQRTLYSRTTSREPTSMEHKVLKLIQKNPGAGLFDISMEVGSSDKAREILSKLLEDEKIKIENEKYFATPKKQVQEQIEKPRDSRRLAYFTKEGGRTSLYTTCIDGTEKQKIVEIEKDISDSKILWSPDNTKITFNPSGLGLYNVYDNVWLVDLVSKKLTQLTKEVDKSDMEASNQGDEPIGWSEDSKRIYYLATRKGDKFFVKSVNIANLETRIEFSKGEGVAVLPGGEIILQLENRGNTDIYTASGGRIKRRLTEHPGEDINAFCTKEGKIVFTSQMDQPKTVRGSGRITYGYDNEIYEIGVDGKGLRRITESPGSKLIGRVFKNIVLYNLYGGGDPVRNIIDLKTGEKSEVPSTTTGALDHYLFYTKERDICVYDSRTKIETNITNTPEVEELTPVPQN